MPAKIIDDQVQEADLVDLDQSMTTEEYLDLTRASWKKLSLIEQMANIGSEVSRALRAKDNRARYWGAVARALDLFYLTVEDPRWKGRLREVLRVRELFAAAALGSDEYKTSLQDLERYFDYFAWIARSDR